MITLKSNREISLMKEAGEVVKKVFEALKEATRPGISTLELDEIAEKTALRPSGRRCRLHRSDRRPTAVGLKVIMIIQERFVSQ